MKRANIFTTVRYSAIAALAVLVGCTGGAPTEQNVDTTGGAPPAAYSGPPPATADVQAFKLNVWDNLQADDRCGACHRDSQTPRFVRSDDINLAFQDANTVVDLTNPGLSRMVERVRQGHHCWLADNNACGDTLTRWISAWASVTQGGSGRQILLTPPTLNDPAPSRIMPANATDGGANSFANTVYPLLTNFCSRCHREDAATPQQPYFAAPDPDVAYEQARTKMNLDLPSSSRFVVRLRSEFHNCWRVPANGAVDCAASATEMENAITQFAGGIPVSPVPSAWLTSKALGLYEGTIASGGNRFEDNQVALYEFKTGSGTTAYDTSGVSPALDLTLSTTPMGGYTWVGGWGVQFTGGKAQGLTTASRKLHTLISQTGEYSIEAWAAPANVADMDRRIVSYSGGVSSRNFSLMQRLYNYDFYARTSSSDLNGMPVLATPDAARALQASLQHVVVTFSPVDGRRIFVNGVQVAAQQANDSLGNWDDTLAFVLGNEASGTQPWLGTLKLVAIHNRALTQQQVQQNFDAGVGEKYWLLFSISHIPGVPPESYIMFEVSQYDSYSYLFKTPKFISLNGSVMPNNLIVKGMRIALNGTEPLVGQAYRPMDVTVTDQMYAVGTGADISSVGTVVPLERGPSFDQFFLTFEQLGTATNVRLEAIPPTPTPPADVARPADIGVRTFDGINQAFAQVTGVQLQGTLGAAGRLRTTYQGLKQQLPTVENFDSFLASHQIAIAQLAIAFCDEMVNDSSLRTSFFGGDFINSSLSTQGERDAIINPVVSRVLGLNLATQPDPVQMHDELNLLIDNTAPGRAQGLCRSTACGTGGRTAVVMKAVCAAGLASSAALVQ